MEHKLLEENVKITKDMISRFIINFKSDPRNEVCMNSVINNGIEAASFNHQSAIKMQYTFSDEIKTGKATNQKKSGRCWIFAGLNVLRQHISQKIDVEDFELSQCYQMFWDKFEKANFFLENIIETLDKDIDDRVVNWLLSRPLSDGGQWDMFSNLVEKYGVVPKYMMPETFGSSETKPLNDLLNLKLRQTAALLRGKSKEGQDINQIREYKIQAIESIYQMLCIFLGEPPLEFVFEYRDKKGGFHRDLALTPLGFYKKYVDLNISDYVSVIHAPTDDKPFNKTYTVKYLGNVKDGKDIIYLNVDLDILKSSAVAQLKENEPVWFGCDVGKMKDRNTGIMDNSLYCFHKILNTHFNMTKADRLDYSESRMTHAMALTGVNLTESGPNRWKVENSWGQDVGKDGFYVMSDAWFDEFVYQIVINKKHLPEKMQKALELKPIELKPWDPMGALA